jgi:hypothetical protein
LRGWGSLEQALFNLFHKLLDTNITSSHIIFAAGIGHQKLREIMLALGGQRLASNVELVSLMESAKKATTTCNHIVHGIWLLEITAKTNKGEETRTATWVRFYQATDAEVFAQRNNETLQQKVRAAHTFPLPRLFALANELDTLAKRINAFCERATLLPVRRTDDEEDISKLKHVKEIGERSHCEDFQHFEPLFQAIRDDLKSGLRGTRRHARMAGIKQGEFFIINGQIAFIAEVGEEFETQYNRRDSRLRVIYDNGTESDILLRSLQRALHRDDAGRRITDPLAGPLFAEGSDDE